MKTERPSSLCDSGIVGDVISISDDDDADGDDHISGRTQTCASRKCHKPSGNYCFVEQYSFYFDDFKQLVGCDIVGC